MCLLHRIVTGLATTVIAFASLAAAEPRGDGGQGRIGELKERILAIASANTMRTDNRAEVRAQVQPLIDELLALAPDRAEAEKLAQVAGGWKNVWTDMRFGPYVDLSQVYQVVFPEGFYYNISRALTPKGAATAFLRGTFRDEGDRLFIRFTDSASLDRWVGPGVSLTALGRRAESGAVSGPGFAPVGATGILRNAYVDGDFRVVLGHGKGEADSCFILVRSDATR